MILVWNVEDMNFTHMNTEVVDKIIECISITYKKLNEGEIIDMKIS